jgi:protein-S-isoprenylcysteine O-methyltransferase Ste14
MAKAWRRVQSPRMPDRHAPPGAPTTRDLGPAVPFPPPILFVLGLGVGLLLDRLLPRRGIGGGVWREVVGVALVAVGLGIVYAGILTFRRFRTAVYPNRPAKLVVHTGIYAHTRNPMYVGMTLFYVGGALVLGSWGILLLLPVVLAVLTTQVIRREERHLRERFPEEYHEYCARVRRWV